MGRRRTALRLALACASAALVAAGAATIAHALAFDDSSPCPVTIDNGQPLLVCPSGAVGKPYSLKIVARGGCEPSFRISVINGSLPSGLSMSSSGQISGTPSAAGTSRFWLQVHDIGPSEGGPAWCTVPKDAEREFMLPIDASLLITTNSVPQMASVGTPYSATLEAQLVTSLNPPSGTPATGATWSVVSGVGTGLPPGLSLGAGVISGTPTTEGAYTFRIQASVGGASHFQTYSLTVRQPLKITGTGLFGGAGTSVGNGELVRTEVGVPFLATLVASGGTGEYTWAIAEGSLPPGVTMANGNFLGRPTTAGVYRVTISAADNEGRIATFPAVATVAERLAVATQRMSPGKVGKKYRAKLIATGGVLPKKWKKASGQLPKGLRLDRKLGIVSGKPKKAGRYRVVFEVTDALGVKSKRAFKITIAPAPEKRG